jgi:leader peptidase (prepilin peptidase) / N-methyltransferase
MGPVAIAKGRWLALGMILGAAAVLGIVSAAVSLGDGLIGFVPLALVVPPLVWIDLRQHRLPRRISHAGALAGGITLCVTALVIGEAGRIIDIGLGLLIALSLMGAIYILGRGIGPHGALGLGDVHLAPLLGIHLGWFGPRAVLDGLLYGWVIAAVVAVVMLLSRKASRGSDIPLGPALIAGLLLRIALEG